MTEPAIARRCPTCGVSIREAASFCPQCGVALTQANFDRTQPLFAPTLEDTITEAAPTEVQVEPRFLAAALEDTITETAPNVADMEVEPPPVTPPEPPKEFETLDLKENVVPVPAVKTASVSTGQTALGAVGSRMQRAATLARDVEGGVVQRAHKVREISSVVLDEASYDPSLRFVLVAAVLFILFLVIVLLNRFIV